MSRTMNACVFALAILTIAAGANLTHAQLGGGEGREVRLFSRNVIVDNRFSGADEVVDSFKIEKESQLRDKVNRVELHEVANLPGKVSVQTLMIAAVDSDEDEMSRLWEIARAELESTLRGLQALSVERVNRELKRQLHELELQQEQAEQDLRRVQEQFLELQVNSPATPDRIRDDLADATKGLRELDLEQVSIDAEREAIEAKIDEVRKSAKGHSEKLERLKQAAKQQINAERERIAVHLKGLEALGENHPDRLALSKKLAEIENGLVVAKVEQASAVAGRELEQLNDRLSELVIRRAGIRARNVHLQNLVEEMSDLLRDSLKRKMQSEPLQQVITRQQEMLNEIEQQLHRVRRERESVRDASITIRPLSELQSDETAQ